MLDRYLKFLKWYERKRFEWFKYRMRGIFHFGNGCDIYTPAITHNGWGEVMFDDGCFVEKGGLGVHFVVGMGGRVSFGKNMWIRTWYDNNVFCCDPEAYIDIGDDSMVSGIMIRVKSGVKTGKRFLGAYGARILDADFHDLDNHTPEKISPIEIGDHVWITSDVTVLGGVKIGSHTVIGAGSLVTEDIPDHCFAAGRPAKPIKAIADRDKTI